MRYVIKDRKDLFEQLHELSGQRFGCWCAPKCSHGDILVRLFRFYDLNTIILGPNYRRVEYSDVDKSTLG
jgi:hypothetical protein